nr:hypothetical protein [Candidatus Hamiltonella defensa]
MMREAGIESKPRQPRYQRSGKEAVYAPEHLNRQFTVKAPNQVGCGDVTDIWSGTCWLYLAVVLDLYARKILGGGFFHFSRQSTDSTGTHVSLRITGKTEKCPLSFRPGESL